MEERAKIYIVNVANRVYDNLTGIFNFIARDNIDAATKLENDIHDEIKNLKNFPNRGLNLRNIINNDTDNKYVVVRKNYAIIYRIAGDEVNVSYVTHLARDLSKFNFD